MIVGWKYLAFFCRSRNWRNRCCEKRQCGARCHTITFFRFEGKRISITIEIAVLNWIEFCLSHKVLLSMSHRCELWCRYVTNHSTIIFIIRTVRITFVFVFEHCLIRVEFDRRWTIERSRMYANRLRVGIGIALSAHTDTADTTSWSQVAQRDAHQVDASAARRFRLGAVEGLRDTVDDGNTRLRDTIEAVVGRHIFVYGTRVVRREILGRQRHVGIRRRFGKSRSEL